MLIEGESGTGKEVIARAIHALSGRDGAFVPVNCGALPENLVESELFGYKKGAFSGAQSDHPGLVRAADGGTLFLDEIGDLPPSSQAALLRVLQEREVMPVGGTQAGRRSTCASSPRPTAISTTWSPSSSSATICSRGSPASASRCRRSPSAAAISAS